MEPIDSFGFWVRSRREALRLSREELASRIGCAQITLRKIEADERRPSVQVAERLAEYLIIPPEVRNDFIRVARADLAVHRLPSPEEVHASASEAVAALPPRSSLIGRDNDTAVIRAQLLRSDRHLLTLIGPPGVGKTRLSERLAYELHNYFADGAYFVPLAALRDHTLVITAIAQAVGIQENQSLFSSINDIDEPLIDRLQVYFSAKQLLLVLDNFEHVLAAAPILSQLLASAPRLKMLVTSRAPLHISGEHEYSIAPLEVPNLAALPPIETLAHIPAIAMFVQRAQAAQPGFTLSAENSAAIAEICVRLDGLPLALELAAARITILTPRSLLARLNSRFGLLTTGPRDAPARHQTLRNAIAWSYDLLEPSAQLLFRQLAVFAGGAQLEAIEAVSQLSPIEVVDTLAALVDHSLVELRRPHAEEPRFSQLATIHELASEQLLITNEIEAARRRHALYYVDFAEHAETFLQGHQQRIWLDRFEFEHDNLRAALAWTIEHQEHDLALRLGAALWLFWQIRGFLSEGRSWLKRILAISEAEHTVSRAKALNGAAVLAMQQSDPDPAEQLCREAFELAQKLGESEVVAHALNNLGTIALHQCDYERTVEMCSQSEILAAQLGLTWLHGWALLSLGYGLLELQQHERAEKAFAEGLHLFQSIGGLRGEAHALLFLAEIAQARRDLAQSTTYATAGVALCREIDDQSLTACLVEQIAYVARATGDYVQASAMLEECLDTALEQGDGWRVSWIEAEICVIMGTMGNIQRFAELLERTIRAAQQFAHPALMALGLISAAWHHQRHGDLEQAAHLLGAAHAQNCEIGGTLRGVDADDYQQLYDLLRAQLTPEQFACAWSTGQAAPLDSVQADVLRLSAALGVRA